MFSVFCVCGRACAFTGVRVRVRMCVCVCVYECVRREREMRDEREKRERKMERGTDVSGHPAKV